MSLREAVVEYWKSYKNSNINHALINMEHIEDISLSEEEEGKIQALLDLCIDEKNSVDIEHLIKVLNEFPSAYMFYFMHELNKKNSRLAMDIISFSESQREKKEEIAFFYRRNIVFERLQILARIFSRSRLEIIEAASS